MYISYLLHSVSMLHACHGHDYNIKGLLLLHIFFNNDNDYNVCSCLVILSISSSIDVYTCKM